MDISLNRFKVKENHGSNWSVQIILVLFIVYGSLIVMNLMTAWIVISQRNADIDGATSICTQSPFIEMILLQKKNIYR